MASAVFMVSLFLAVLVTLFISAQLSSVDDEYDEMKRHMAEAAMKQGIDIDNLAPGQMMMMPPKTTEEDKGSRQIPRDLRCDACAAIAYQFELQYKVAEKHVKKGQKLPMADQIDVADVVCESNLGDYGVKDVNGVRKFSGAGLPTSDHPGILEAGGMWLARMKDLCRSLVEEFEEDGIYQQYLNKGDSKLVKTLCISYCTDEEADVHDNYIPKKDEL